LRTIGQFAARIEQKLIAGCFIGSKEFACSFGFTDSARTMGLAIIIGFIGAAATVAIEA
jgi:hypothetical protein